MHAIEISNRQQAMNVDGQRLRQAAEAILTDAGLAEAVVSIALVDDPTIHQLNRQFLEHDEPTDVLSFVLEAHGDYLEGEIIVSTDTALRESRRWNWPADDELLLYVIHGMLHLVGYDDLVPEARLLMRQAEQRCLARFGLQAPSGFADTHGDSGGEMPTAD